MNWFKHFTGYRNDPKVKALREEFGVDGYAIPIMLVEIVAESVGVTNPSPFLTYSAKTWAELLSIPVKKFNRVVSKMQEINLFDVTVERDGKITFGTNKILEYCDRYTETLIREGKISDHKTNHKSSQNSNHTSDHKTTVRKKEVERKKERSMAARPRADGENAQKIEASTQETSEDPKARAEAMKTIKDAIKTMNPSREVIESQPQGTGKIPTATGPEVEEMGVNLQLAGVAEGSIQQILNAWWAVKNGTHDVYALAGVLDNHGVKGQDRTRIYNTLGVA